MAFDEEAAERWYQSRVGVRQVDPKDTTSRLRNTQRSFWEKEYTGGPLRGAVSDRRAEWMGGGAGGRLGEDWRNHQMIDVDRHGSGLDPYSHAVVKRIKGRVDDGRKRRALGRAMNDQTAKADSAAKIEGMRSWRNEPAEEEATTVEPTTPTPTMEPEAAAKTERVISPEQRAKMDKRNERARQRRAQGNEAISMLSAYSMQDESPSGPMWGGSATGTGA